MSASLVGSEMCIRDSVQSRLGLARIPSARRTEGRSLGAQATSNSAWRAVSYTHLTLPTICSV
eukprot:1718514-Alexandrium_andersonii.AAC.1